MGLSKLKPRTAFGMRCIYPQLYSAALLARPINGINAPQRPQSSCAGTWRGRPRGGFGTRVCPLRHHRKRLGVLPYVPCSLPVSVAVTTVTTEVWAFNAPNFFNRYQKR